MVDIHAIINLDRYPIDRLDSHDGKALLARCQRELADDGSLLLEDFVKPSVIAKMAAEVSDLDSYHRLQIVGPYHFATHSAEFPDSHPTRKLVAQDVHAVAADRIPPACLLRKVYDSPEVLRFLAAVLRIPKLYQFADPLQCINVMYMKDGGSRAWHYDGSDFVVTLLLQQCLHGGEFEWAPFIRGQNGEENFEQVDKLFRGLNSTAKTSRAGAGALALFNGRRSMHRVRAVYGPQMRIQSVLSYDTLPPHKQKLSPPEKNVALYGERARKITAANLQQRRSKL